VNMRRVFGEVLAELMIKDEKIVLIVCDIGFSIFDLIRNNPLTKDRFFNLGIAEQAIIGVAAGMALEGFKPYVYTITPFLIERPFEQVKLDIDQQNVNVKLVGYADYPGQGPTHSEIITPEIASKLFNNIKCYAPKNGEETRKILLSEYERVGPAYISLKKDK
jgi:transketolase